MSIEPQTHLSKYSLKQAQKLNGTYQAPSAEFQSSGRGHVMPRENRDSWGMGIQKSEWFEEGRRLENRPLPSKSVKSIRFHR